MFGGCGVAVVTGTDEHSRGIMNAVNDNPDRVLQNLLKPSIVGETKALKGAHNLQNMRAAYAALIATGLGKSSILEAFESFSGLLHRQFLVRSIGNVAYVNDSKATNAEATSKALGSFENIYWIVGGQAKDVGLKGLEDFLPRVRCAFLIGQSSDAFADYLGAHGVEFVACDVMSEAVKKAHAMAQAADKGTVLLSPAAASFDQYPNFEVRGDEFTELVEAL